jgi:hypothetical protein
VLFVLHLDPDDVLILELTAEEPLAERIFEIMLNGPAQWSSAEFRVIALLNEEFLGRVA